MSKYSEKKERQAKELAAAAKAAKYDTPPPEECERRGLFKSLDRATPLRTRPVRNLLKMAKNTLRKADGAARELAGKDMLPEGVRDAIARAAEAAVRAVDALAEFAISQEEARNPNTHANHESLRIVKAKLAGARGREEAGRD